MKNNKLIGLAIANCFLFAQVSTASAINLTEQVTAYIEDSEITLAIYSKFIADPMLNPLDIDVQTNDGVVDLIGQVETKDQRADAVKVAKETDGVKKINSDNLFVNASDQPMTDTWITTKVKAALLKEKLINKHDIADLHVETKNGKVYLSGEATKENAAYAQKVVEKISGLKNKVVNQIKIVKTIKAESPTRTK